jgi:squalene-associated FAD-dependent desaturase
MHARDDSPRKQRVAIVGGGLAGLAAAVNLCGSGHTVELFESRRQVGGRAASFRDPATGELVDYCQHVSLGCCNEFAAFCQTTGIADSFRRDRVLHFFKDDGRRYDVQGTPWLPAPLHLTPALLKLGYLSWRERVGLAGAMLALRHSTGDDEAIGPWLRRHGQSERAIRDFWAVVLNSALGESVERAGIAYARKVFVDAFLTSPDGYEVLVPLEPLSELFGRRVVEHLRARGAMVHEGRGVKRVEIINEKVRSLLLDDGSSFECDAAIVAVPWRHVTGMFDKAVLAGPLRNLQSVNEITGAPITGVHLWFDREITPLPHAVLVGMESQWLFNRGRDASSAGYYYQVVISASHGLEGRPRDEVVASVVSELAKAFSEARAAKLLNSRVVTDVNAVFSPVPGIDRLRPPQKTAIANLALAGDWTATGWPGTMESAVRSGQMAAEAIAEMLKSEG